MRMDFPVGFYEDEVRYGFYVPTAVKQAWAAELMVLAEIDRICRKYGIKYFVHFGTLLGAIRHKGFVPWDDDIDIAMLREDYIRFRQVAAKELPDGYAIHDFESKEDHWLFLSRVVNRNQICFDEEHLEKYHNFPYIAPVDIFVLDYLYRDEEKEKERCTEIKTILATADLIVGRGLAAVEPRVLKSLEKKYDINFSQTKSNRQIGIELYRIAQKQMARVSREESDTVGQIFPWILKGRSGMPKEYYDRALYMPFENMEVPVPVEYHAVAQYIYGDYMVVYKGSGLHDYPFFEKQKENLYAVADDFRLPEFTFTPDMLSGDRGEQTKCLKDIVKEYIGVLEEQMLCFEAQVANHACSARDILSECQNLAVDLGTLLEEVKGEENPDVKKIVSGIEAYCESLYEVYELMGTADNLEKPEFAKHILDLKCAWETVKQTVNEELQKKVVLFLSTGRKQWGGFKKLYEMSIADEKNEVYVIVLPVAFKDIYGRTTFQDAERTMDTGFLPGVVQLSWKTVDIHLLHPDIIYIQNPYDGENPCLTIPPQFYSKQLRDDTDLLIYVPPYCVGEFGKEDYCDVYNMKHYVTAPAVMYADRVLVQSENMKEMYIWKLTEFAGEQTRDIWEGKLETAEYL